jgi:hypothetical protein
MKDIDDMLNKWIFSSVVRERIRKVIAKAIQDSYDKGWIDSRF